MFVVSAVPVLAAGSHRVPPPRLQSLASLRIRRAILGCGLFALSAVLTGCGSGEKQVAVYPVSGKVLFNGQPAAGAVVVLHPKAGLNLPSDVAATGVVKEDGSFKISVYGDGDGAPAGEYVATLQWFKVVQSEGGSARGPNVIPKQYSAPDTSPVKVTVTTAENTLPPIEIKG